MYFMTYFQYKNNLENSSKSFPSMSFDADVSALFLSLPIIASVKYLILLQNNAFSNAKIKEFLMIQNGFQHV